MAESTGERRLGVKETLWARENSRKLRILRTGCSSATDLLCELGPSVASVSKNATGKCGLGQHVSNFQWQAGSLGLGKADSDSVGLVPNLWEP